MTRTTIDQRFMDKVRFTDSCWIWSAGKDKDGYGRFSIRHGSYVRSHRFSYELYVGKIPSGLVIDHLCRNTSCVNPEHLEVVTQRENILRGVGVAAKNIKKTHCISGHELYGDNLYVNKKTGKRFCRECDRRRGGDYESRKRTK